MCFSLGLILFITLIANVFCDGLISWSMSDLCGAEISKYNFAGEIYFDAEKLRNNDFGDGCTLTITPATLNQNGGNKVMFYFTAFEFQSDCDIISVTIRDGRYRDNSVVQGLPRYLCGINSTLTEQVFSTNGGSVRIHVNIKRHWNYIGYFRLKFVTYHTGSCDESDVSTCSNGRCIPLEYNCSENIKACGEVDDKCTEEAADENIRDWFGNVIRYLFILIGFICIICLLKVMVKQGKRKCGQLLDGMGDCFRDIRLKCADCRRSVNLSRFRKPRLPHFIRSRLRSNTQNTPDESTDDRSTTEGVANSAFSNSDTQIDQMIQAQISIQSPPMSTALPQSMTSQNEPPSYEEAMASSTHSFPSLQPEDPAPLYEEVISPNEMAVSFQSEEYSTTIDENSFNSRSNDNIETSEADDMNNDTNERIMTSNIMIQSSLNTDTSSILNNYLCDFAVELSDDYSSDPDWDSLSNSSVLSQGQTAVTQSVISASNEPNEEGPVPLPTYDDAVPPPYYYDYIANVSRYKQDSVRGSDA
ncbi:uncharacterized protein LOC123557182 [Mercenaria mercenaria]|uniref:uncharacterized protein LOC123557182 n=1 Tax=Mercenaria mercenaria TaxID=6596 RepID=UPI00234E4E94|nr:uncharacterized protein LOC123557182 [Mercenaria mercenaria]